MKIYYGGTIGGMNMMVSILDPPKEKCIANAKAMIAAHRRCVIANAKQGIRYRGLYWLNRAAFYRRQIKWTNIEK